MLLVIPDASVGVFRIAWLHLCCCTCPFCQRGEYRRGSFSTKPRQRDFRKSAVLLGYCEIFVKQKGRAEALPFSNQELLLPLHFQPLPALMRRPRDRGVGFAGALGNDAFPCRQIFTAEHKPSIGGAVE